MLQVSALKNVAQTFQSVNTPDPNTSPPLPDMLIHHKDPTLPDYILVRNKDQWMERRYGVSKSQRVLSPGLLLRKWEIIKHCLQSAVGLTTSEREGILRLLRLWAYYGLVYPTAHSIAEERGCSVPTFWRAIKKLRNLGLIQVINRFVLRPEAQISNLYIMDRLILLIARYLSEHGIPFLEKWLEPYLSLPGRVFWKAIWQNPGGGADPCGEGAEYYDAV